MTHYRLGRHDVQADFTGTPGANVTLTHRPDAIAFDNLTAFSLGPVANGDVSQNITSHSWYVRADNAQKKVFLARNTDADDAWLPEVELFSFVGVDLIEIDLAFEQAGRPFVCASRATGPAGAKEVWLYWFNPVHSAFEFSSFGTGRTPRCLIDNPLDVTDSDIMVFYVNDTVGGVCYRQQRDRYAIEYPTPFMQGAEASPGIFLPVTTAIYVEDVIRTTDNRMTVLCSAHENGRYEFRKLVSGLYPFFPPPGEMTAPNASLESGIFEFVLLIITAPDDVPPFFPDAFIMRDENQMQSPNTLMDSGDLHSIIIIYDSGLFAEDNQKQPNPTLQSGSLVIPITIYDGTAFPEDFLKQPAPTMQSGSLVVYILVYDDSVNTDDLMKQPNPTLQSGSLV